MKTYISLIILFLLSSCSNSPFSQASYKCFSFKTPAAWKLVDVKEVSANDVICSKTFSNESKEIVQVVARKTTFSREKIKHALASKVVNKYIKGLGYLTGEVMWQTAFYNQGPVVTYRGLVSSENTLLTFVTHLDKKTYKKRMESVKELIRSLEF